MKFGEFAPGWNRIIGAHKTYKLKDGDRITTANYPDIEKPYCQVFKDGYAGHTMEALGFDEAKVMVYTRYGKGDSGEAARRLPLNPIFSKPLPLP